MLQLNSQSIVENFNKKSEKKNYWKAWRSTDYLVQLEKILRCKVEINESNRLTQWEIERNLRREIADIVQYEKERGKNVVAESNFVHQNVWRNKIFYYCFYFRVSMSFFMRSIYLCAEETWNSKKQSVLRATGVR